MESKLMVEVVTQHGMIYRGEADGLIVPGLAGYLGILPRHAPLIAELGVGELKVRHGTDMVRYALSGGVLHVRDRHAVIMADAVEPVHKIDVERAQHAEMRARERLRPGPRPPDLDLDRARLALARAINRLRLAGSIDS